MNGSTAYAEHLSAPRGRGRLTGATHTGAAGGAACGDLVRISVEVEGDRVVEAGFDAHGCHAATAAGSAAVELLEGAAVLEAALVTPATVAGALGGLAPARHHAAELAADALHRALGSAAAAGDVTLPPSAERTLVAMSGGVDSAVAAQLALDAGHEVLAVTLELWADPASDGTASCCSPQAVTGARALAHRMGLPHVTLDLREQFRAEVVNDFVAEHAAGRTPNPCVRCNGLVRFDEMLTLAGRLGAPRLATGHYARIVADGEGLLLSSGVDSAKDQAYMLAGIGPERLERLWFPLGELEKPRARELARAAGLPVADKAESQDLCFLSGVGRDAFLARHAPEATGGDGAIVGLSGEVLGRHGGQERFTVGQRRGLGVQAPEPLFVVAKDAPSGTVTVGPRAALGTRRVQLRGARLNRHGRQVDRVKLRYRSEPVACRLAGEAKPGTHDRLTVILSEVFEGAAPGQTACLLRGDVVLGHGTIGAATSTELPLAA